MPVLLKKHPNHFYTLITRINGVNFLLILGGPVDQDEAPNSRTIPNESGSSIQNNCKDRRSWCRAADCSIDIVMLLCPKRCKVCNIGKRKYHYEGVIII